MKHTKLNIFYTYYSTIASKALLIIFFIFSITTISIASDEYKVPSGVRGLFDSPSPVSYKGKLYVFNQDINEKGYIEYRVKDGEIWSLTKRIPNTKTSTSPYAIVYKDILYVFHQGEGKHGDIRYTRFNGEQWSEDLEMDKVKLSESPALCVYNDKLYLFFQGKGHNSSVWYTAFDGKNWTEQEKMRNVGTSASPSVVSYNGKLYLFHQGKRDSKELWLSIFDGTHWIKDKKLFDNILINSPKAVVHNNQIYVFHQSANGDGAMKYFTYNENGHSANNIIPSVYMSASPGATVHNDELHIFHQYGDKKGFLFTFKKEGENFTKDQPLETFSFSKHFMDSKFGSYTIPATNHSYLSPPYFKTSDNNQEEGVPFQLKQGIRYIELNIDYVHNKNYDRDIAIFATGHKEKNGSIDPMEELPKIVNWLNLNPEEILLIKLSTYLTREDMIYILKKTGLYDHIYCKETVSSQEDIPTFDLTPRDIVNSGRRIIIIDQFNIYRSITCPISNLIKENIAWVHDDIYKFDPTIDIGDVTKSPLSQNTLYSLQYFGNNTVGYGSREKAEILSEYETAKFYFLEGWRESLRRPFTFTFDFSTYGDYWKLLYEMNHKYNSIYGRVYDEDNNYIEDVLLRVIYSSDEARTIKVISNAFDCPVRHGETVTVIPKKDGYSFKPESLTYSNTDHKNIDIIFKSKKIAPTKNLNTNSTDEQFIINPNPFTSKVNIRFDNKDKTPVTLSVYNLYGQLVDSKSFESPHNNIQEINYNTSKLQNGYYLFEVKCGDEIFSSKAIKK